MLPTTRELFDAMSGAVPEDHPSITILRAAFMLATIGEWMSALDSVVTDDGDSGSEVLWALGFDDYIEFTRRHLVDRITTEIPDHPEIGPLIEQVACAWRQWKIATNSRQPPYTPFMKITVQTLIDARHAYEHAYRHATEHPATHGH
jgi:hypothetical protein